MHEMIQPHLNLAGHKLYWEFRSLYHISSITRINETFLMSNNNASIRTIPPEWPGIKWLDYSLMAMAYGSLVEGTKQTTFWLALSFDNSIISYLHSGYCGPASFMHWESGPYWIALWFIHPGFRLSSAEHNYSVNLSTWIHSQYEIRRGCHI